MTRWLINEGFVMVPRFAAAAFAPVLRKAVDDASRNAAVSRDQLAPLAEIVTAFETLATVPADGSAGGSVPGAGSVPPRERGAPCLRGISTVDAASRLGVTDRAVRKALLNGRLTGVKTGGRWIVDPDSIERPKHGSS